MESKEYNKEVIKIIKQREMKKIDYKWTGINLMFSLATLIEAILDYFSTIAILLLISSECEEREQKEKMNFIINNKEYFID